jgi:sulfatase modifying factor 1
MRLVSLALFALGIAMLGAPPALAVKKKSACPVGMVSVGGKFCIDAYEASVDIVSRAGLRLRKQSPYDVPKKDVRLAARSKRGVVPQAHISQLQAESACEAVGKRLCTDTEWKAACVGKTPTTYPYGDEHVEGRCNDKGVSPLRKLHGKADGLDVFGMEAMNDSRLNQIPGTVARTGKFGKCRSSFGAYDMVGNLHEWTADPSGTFRGGYYLDNAQHGDGCNYITTGHDTKYHDYSIGFRCCKGGSGPPKTAKQKPAKSGAKKKVTVASGDTLSGIAQRNGVSVDELVSANGLDPKDPIQPGQELVIPGP